VVLVAICDKSAMSEGDDRADALDVLIEQEHQLIARFEARHTSAQAVTTTVITSAFSVAALITAGAQTIQDADKRLAWAAVAVLGVVLVVALLSRFLGGLHARRTTRGARCGGACPAAH